MRFLLDTHTFLWQLDRPELLPNQVKLILEDRSAVMLISIATPWEIAIKNNTGKLDARHVLEDFEAKATSTGFLLLQTTIPHAIRSGGLPLHHRDPFDRLMIAQALELDLPILSNDSIFDLYGVRRIWN